MSPPQGDRLRSSRALRYASRIFSAILCIPVIAAIYQVAAHRRDLRDNPPPGQLVDVGGYRMHLHCIGQGSPTVILDSGLSDSSLSWYKVQPQVARVPHPYAFFADGWGRVLLKGTALAVP